MKDTIHIPTRIFSMAVLTLLIVAIPGAFGQITYSITDLGTLPGDSFSAAASPTFYTG